MRSLVLHSLVLVILLLGLSAVAREAWAGSPNGPAGTFEGVVCINLDCGSASTQKLVTAVIGDVECGSARTSGIVDGPEVAYYAMRVAPEDEIAGCGVDGREVRFVVDGVEAKPRVTWRDERQYVSLWTGPDFAAFGGSLTKDGWVWPVPCAGHGYDCYGPVVRASINGTLCGTKQPHGYFYLSGYSLLLVQSAESTPGCGVGGVMIRFTVDGLAANETAVWSPGFHSLNLSVGAPIPKRWGDFDCSGGVTIGDAQKIARSLIGLSVSQGPDCPQPGADVIVDGTPRKWGDLDCLNGLTIGDAVKTARHLIGLPIGQAQDCPKPGVVVSVTQA